MSDRFFETRYNLDNFRFKKKDFKSLEITEYFINKISEKEDLNCFITKTFDKAVEMAKISDEKIMKNQNLGNLEGIPLGMKDLFCTKNIKTTAGSKFLSHLFRFMNQQYHKIYGTPVQFY